jgi:hypothetical protein
LFMEHRRTALDSITSLLLHLARQKPRFGGL